MDTYECRGKQACRQRIARRWQAMPNSSGSQWRRRQVRPSAGPRSVVAGAGALSWMFEGGVQWIRVVDAWNPQAAMTNRRPSCSAA
jgi:hypothetical protein